VLFPSSLFLIAQQVSAKTQTGAAAYPAICGFVLVDEWSGYFPCCQTPGAVKTLHFDVFWPLNVIFSQEVVRFHPNSPAWERSGIKTPTWSSASSDLAPIPTVIPAEAIQHIPDRNLPCACRGGST